MAQNEPVRRPDDPFALLELQPTATANEVRAARRRLAKAAHPDVGGSDVEMQRVNRAAADAITLIRRRSIGSRSHSDNDDLAGSSPQHTADPTRSDDEYDAIRHDRPSFTIEALPAEAFEGLLIVAESLGELVDDDPPYRLDAHMAAPWSAWCRLELAPDAGSSSVSLTVTGETDGSAPPAVEAVRNAWIDALNRLDWDDLDRSRPHPSSPSSLRPS